MASVDGVGSSGSPEQVNGKKEQQMNQLRNTLQVLQKAQENIQQAMDTAMQGGLPANTMPFIDAANQNAGEMIGNMNAAIDMISKS